MGLAALLHRLAPAALSVAGAGLLGFVAFSATRPPPPPYELRLFRSAGDAFAELSSEKIETKALERLEVTSPDAGKPIAMAILLHDDAGRKTPLEWRNAITEPVFFADLPASDVNRAVSAIRDHVEEDAVVLAWWDFSRAVRKMARRNAPLDDPQARGLLLPSSWAGQAPLIADRGKTAWGAGVPAEEGEVFGRFLDALLLDEQAGADALGALAQGRPAYVAVHLSDAWKVATARPDALALAYRDFPGGGHSHGVMKAARAFVEREKIDGGYMVEPVGEAIRLHYLVNKASADLLIARLLPFSTGNPMKLDRFQLVFQHRGYWIYRLNPAKKS